MKVLRSSLTAVLSAIMRTWLSESMEHMTYVVKMNITARPSNKWDSPAQSFLGSPMYLLSLHSRRFQKLTQRELNWEGVQKKNLHVGNKTGREFFFPPNNCQKDQKVAPWYFNLLNCFWLKIDGPLSGNPTRVKSFVKRFKLSFIT